MQDEAVPEVRKNIVIRISSRFLFAQFILKAMKRTLHLIQQMMKERNDSTLMFFFLKLEIVCHTMSRSNGLYQHKSFELRWKLFAKQHHGLVTGTKIKVLS